MIDLNLCWTIFIAVLWVFHFLSFIILSGIVFHLEEDEKRDWPDIISCEIILVFCASIIMISYLTDMLIDWDKKHSKDIVKKNKHE